MFYEPYIIIIILLFTMTLFILGKWRYDVIALIALALAVATKAIPFNQVYDGLKNPAVITVACVMIISNAITQTDLLHSIVQKLSKTTYSPSLQIGILTLTSACLSAFMNNVGALALMMPIAIQSAKKSSMPSSLVLLPIALGSAMGGLTTLIGTPPNLLIAAYKEEVTGQAFSMFSYSKVGIFLAIIGVIYLSFIGWRLLGKKTSTHHTSDDLFEINDYITEVKVPEESPLANQALSHLTTITSSDFIILGIIRNQSTRLNITNNLIIKPHDILIIEASASDLQKITESAKLDLIGDVTISKDQLKSNEITLIEAVIPQASRLENRSCKSLRLRSRFNVNVLAVSRQGIPFKERLNNVKLISGDIILLQGNYERLQDIIKRFGLLPLEERGLAIKSSPKAYLSILFFLLAIIASALKLVPVEVSFGGVVLLIMIFHIIPIRKIYENIDWSIIILLAAMIPLGKALETTGGTALITHYIMQSALHLNPSLTLLLFMFITMTLSDFMNNAATTVVMAPIALSLAHALHVNIDPFLMGTAIAASCSFLTPIGHQNNTIVMGPGQYKFIDYIKIGLPLEIIILSISVPLLTRMWPF